MERQRYISLKVGEGLYTKLAVLAGAGHLSVPELVEMILNGADFVGCVESLYTAFLQTRKEVK